MKNIIFIAMLFSALSAFAHPHVWIDADIEFKCTDKGKCYSESVWKFDNMFSAVILNDFDIDGDKVFIGIEHKKLKKGMFDNLANFGYFQNIQCDRDNIYIDKVENFKASVDGDRVVYKFKAYYDAGACVEGYEFFMHDSTAYTDITIKNAKGKKHKLLDDGYGKNYIEFKK
jgi:ABC-type uncharacterized transport system substrate-binding protein